MQSPECCKHPQLKRPPDLVVDATGETVLLYECLICGCRIGLSLNSQGEVERGVIIPPAQKCA